MSLEPPEPANQRPDFRIARFEHALGLPEIQTVEFTDVQQAVREEYRDASRQKMLVCRTVSAFVDGERGVVHVIEVDGSIEFDWTWEGATAYRPASFDQSLENQSSSDPHSAVPTFTEDDDPTTSNHILWSGEILEVDEDAGQLFISPKDPEVVPSVGEFLVQPFEFLSSLNEIYNHERFNAAQSILSARLAATLGNVHPTTEGTSSVGLSHLSDWWRHSWSILWGPPGTGKTYTTGRQIAAVLATDPSERILVVSTTNQATDEVAASIGTAIIDSDNGASQLESNSIRRIGKGSSLRKFREAGLMSMLAGTEAELLAEIDFLSNRLRRTEDSSDKALLNQRIKSTRAALTDISRRTFLDANVSVVVTTSFKAGQLLGCETVRSLIENREAPFTTIFVDEAGLISRAAVASLSLLASRRIVLVGDSKQLAPISRVSRTLPSRKSKWLASSGVSHLRTMYDNPPAVHVLSEQHRMHPLVCETVSNYQYNGQLTTAEKRMAQPSTLTQSLADFGRAIWYVLDEEDVSLHRIRASRGSGNKSWVRNATGDVIQKLFEDDHFKNSRGLFVSPFRAQANVVSRLFARWNASTWTASTVHCQQGAESDIVIFDSVNAGNPVWPITQWQRLVNVAISRAREAVIVIASRAEMEEPHLRPLADTLTPAVLDRDGETFQWRRVDPHQNRPSLNREHENGLPTSDWQPKHNLGSQFADNKRIRPVLTREQQRLSQLRLDGKPRIVRGVAGSGKSLVLSNWVARTAESYDSSTDHADGEPRRIWAVFANRSLKKLLQDGMVAAWESNQRESLLESRPFPWHHVRLIHIRDLLGDILSEVGLNATRFRFDYNRAAIEFLDRVKPGCIEQRCDALFIDEAQDMGPETLRLLFSLIRSNDMSDANSRPAHVFYDDAQNIYNQKRPTWSDFGLDVRGRATVMRESFRSTRPIMELAVNVSYRLNGGQLSPENKDLVRESLLVESARDGVPWLEINYNETQGQNPFFESCPTDQQQLELIGRHLIHLVSTEQVEPNDICILYNGKAFAETLLAIVGPVLSRLPLEVELSHQTSQTFQRRSDSILLTTPNSFKGFEAEVVLIAGADRFVGEGGRVLSHSLYVAMTRARSILGIYGTYSGDMASKKISTAIAECVRMQRLDSK